MVKVDRVWALEVENTSATDTVSDLHVVEVSFREDWQDGRPTVRIAFEDIPLLTPQTKAVLKHTAYVFDEYSNAWLKVDAANDRLILLTEKAAGKPITMDVQFIMNDKNCYQVLGAGQGGGLNFERE